MTKVLARVLAVAGAVVLVLLGAAGPGYAHLRPAARGEDPRRRAAGGGHLVGRPGRRARAARGGLGRNRGVPGYLGRGVAVSQDARPCPLTGVSDAALATTGAVLRFRCARPADALELRVSLLHDVDRDYRTVSVTPSGSGGLHTAGTPPSPYGSAAGPWLRRRRVCGR